MMEKKIHSGRTPKKLELALDTIYSTSATSYYFEFCPS